MTKSQADNDREPMTGSMNALTLNLIALTRRNWIACATVAAAACVACTVTKSTNWTDPASHRVTMITVAPSVQLEVLDWGSGQTPMVFLAGLGDTGHAFDNFAARFQDGFHPIAITRRGFGASSRPRSGYDSATRAHDILVVLDSLHITRAILVGHSIAGDELSRFATEYPDRVIALVYLEAYSYGSDAPGAFPPYPEQADPPAMTSADSASIQSVMAYWPRRFEYEPVEADVRAVTQFGPTGRLELLPAPNEAARVYEGTTRSDYARIVAPALAIYSPHESLEHLFPGAKAFDEQNRSAALRYLKAQQQYEKTQISRFELEMRHGVVMMMPGASHYLHYHRAHEVERAIRAFLAGLSPGANLK